MDDEAVATPPPEPTPIESAAQFRRFIRDYVNSTEGKIRIKAALEGNDKILAQAMTIAAGNFSEDGSTPGSGLSTTNLIFIENVLQMGPEAMKRYADTGELAAGPQVRTIELPAATRTENGSDPTWTAAEPVNPAGPSGGGEQARP